MSVPLAVKSLLKPIYIDDAKPTGLRRVFAQPPSHEDTTKFFLETCLNRLAAIAAQFGLNVCNPAVREKIALRVIERKPELWSEDTQGASNIIVRALLAAIRPAGSKRVGRPPGSYKVFAQSFADVNFLRRKTNMSVRNICLRLPKMKDYKERWGSLSPQALRKKYQEGVTLQKNDFEFSIFLSGLGALVPGMKIDPVDEAIKDHALKK